jgi:hypothetical protein
MNHFAKNLWVKDFLTARAEVAQTFLSAGSRGFPTARSIAGLESPANPQVWRPAPRIIFSLA